LLEVGTGFHPELSGRENIYLNGTLLGMRRREIKAVFDEIVDFAGVERFIDTPVKRYSSGMYVRLAFAVAAHLRPEILIIDEVLAVGDIGFQKKCLGKMQDVTGEGRTVLFVSHSLSTVNSLCEQCLLLENGRVKQIGPTAEVTNAYFDTSQGTSGSELNFTDNPQGDDIAALLTARLIDRLGNPISHVKIDAEFGIELTYDVRNTNQPIIPNLHFFQAGTCAFVTSPNILPEQRTGFCKAIAWLPARLLNEGNYNVNIAASTMNPVTVHFHLQDLFSFQVIEDIHDSARQGYAQKIPGAVRPVLDWTVTTTRP
jgi:lipopolysaccharide transport system ATP-binding protein